MKRLSRWIMVLTGLVLIGGVGVWWTRAHAASTTSPDKQATASEPVVEAKPVAVTVAAVTTHAIRRQVRIVGTLHGCDEIDIAPQVDGRISRVLHDVGDIVRPGDVLLEIDDVNYRLVVDEMSRGLDLELARLGLSALPDKDFDVRKLPTVERAKVVEQNAVSVLARNRQLEKNNAVSLDELQRAEMNVRVAELDFKQRLIDAEQSLASIRHRAAALETVRQRLLDTKVTAPQLNSTQPFGINLVSATTPLSATGKSTKPTDSTVEYTVAGRYVSEGELVRSLQPTKLFRLVVENPLKLKTAVPERYAGQLHVDQAVELTVEAYPGRKFVGTVARVNPTVDHASRSFAIEVCVPNPERQLKAGAFSVGSVLTEEDAAALVVPQDAISRFAGVIKVFVIENGAARAVPVELGERSEASAGDSESWIEVRGALKAGDIVVTSGQSQLADGTRVRVREELPTK